MRCLSLRLLQEALKHWKKMKLFYNMEIFWKYSRYSLEIKLPNCGRGPVFPVRKNEKDIFLKKNVMLWHSIVTRTSGRKTLKKNIAIKTRTDAVTAREYDVLSWSRPFQRVTWPARYGYLLHRAPTSHLYSCFSTLESPWFILFQIIR